MLALKGGRTPAFLSLGGALKCSIILYCGVAALNFVKGNALAKKEQVLKGI